MAKGSIGIKNIDGDVIGAGVEGNSNIFGKNVTFNGPVMFYDKPSSEMQKLFNKIDGISTEVMPGDAAGIQGSKSIQDAGKLKEGIDEILDIIKTSGKSEQVQAGDLRISRVDLLLKKAMLLGSEANQKLFDYLEKNQDKIKQKLSATVQSMREGFDPGSIQNEIYADFDMATHMEKLKEIYDLLKEANEIDPTNTEVLLHMAQLLIYLTPDDPHDEQEIINRIRTLLSYPKNETERFHLAQATYLLALSKKDDELLFDARAMFDKLGQREWVRAIDRLAELASNAQKPVQQGVYSPQQIPPQAGFQPFGRWQIQISDGSILYLNLAPDGFQAVQQRFGMNIQATGNWVFNPNNQMLQIQGIINGFQPFMLGITIQGQQNNGFYGAGTDGYSYFLTKA